MCSRACAPPRSKIANHLELCKAQESDRLTAPRAFNNAIRIAQLVSGARGGEVRLGGLGVVG